MNLERYMIAEEGLFSRMKEKKAAKLEQENAAFKEKWNKIYSDIGPKIRPILTSTQNAIYSLLKQNFGNYKGIRITREVLKPSDFLDSIGYFCYMDTNVDGMSEQEEREFWNKTSDVEKQIRDVVETCGQKCCAVIKKIPGYESENFRYSINDDTDEVCAIGLSIDF